jgi:hypothetical protein
MRNDACVDAELGERLPSARAVNDDTVETPQDARPQGALRRGSPREQVVRREDGGHAEARVDVELGHGEPLHVQDVCTCCGERSEHVQVLDGLQRKPHPRPPEESGRDRVEPLRATVSSRLRQLSETEARSPELDVGAGACERLGELVVVPRRERRRIGQDDAHSPTVERVADPELESTA